MKTIQEIKEVKKLFAAQYKHLHTEDNKTGLNGIGFGSDPKDLGIAVRALDQETLNKIPDEFMDVPVFKQVIGQIKIRL